VGNCVAPCAPGWAQPSNSAAASAPTTHFGAVFLRLGGESGKPADKPGSVERPYGRRAVIPLGDMLPCRSCSLPGSDASHVIAPLFGLAPDGVYRAVRVTTSAVSSYLTLSPLPDICGRRRYPFCCRVMHARVTPPHAVQITYITESALRPTLSIALAVSSVWRPAVSRHPALRGPDFPRYA